MTTKKRPARAIALVSPGDPIKADQWNQIARAVNDIKLEAPKSLDEGIFTEGQGGDLDLAATENRDRRVEEIVRVFQDDDPESDNWVDIAYATTKVYVIEAGDLAGYSIVLTGDP